MSTQEYPAKRTCHNCPATFDKNELVAHADHMATHQPTYAQWAAAYRRILAGADAAKKRAKAE